MFNFRGRSTYGSYFSFLVSVRFHSNVLRSDTGVKNRSKSWFFGQYFRRSTSRTNGKFFCLYIWQTKHNARIKFSVIFKYLEVFNILCRLVWVLVDDLSENDSASNFANVTYVTRGIALHLCFGLSVNFDIEISPVSCSELTFLKILKNWCLSSVVLSNYRLVLCGKILQ